MHLTVKFDDQRNVRSPADLPDLDSAISKWNLTFRLLVQVDDARLDALEARAVARVGYATDLRSLYVVDVPNADRDTLLAVAEALDTVDGVAYVYLRGSGWEPPGDISPATDDWVDLQGWLGPDPGIDAYFAHDRGIRGANVGVADCEYDWNEDHEDLVDVDLGREQGQRSPSYTEEYQFDQHGTAVVGMIVAGDNGYGALGAAPEARVTTWPEATVDDDGRRVTAIANAVADAAVGDIVMLEMQVVYRPGGDYGPAELDPAVYEVVRMATDAGVIIVAAAGNGEQDLDDTWYENNWLEWGDSGAIIVGAGTPDEDHDTVYFSSYGSRVNLQGWGYDVFTTGYGDAYEVGRDIDQAYTYFSGTSSATPMVAAAAALVQDYRLAHDLEPLDAWEMRELLVETGRPRGEGGEIGPLPDVAAAIGTYDADDDGFVAEELGGDDCDDSDDDVNPDGDEDDEEPDGEDLNCDGETPDACGCATPGPVGAAPWLALALALVARRRRHQL